MTISTTPPARLPSEDVIVSAPMSYAGAAQRIFRLRRRARSPRAVVATTAVAVTLTAVAWALITVWYLTWNVMLVPYRLLRRSARKRRVEALRHRELLGTIQGAAAASAAAIVAAQTAAAVSASAETSPQLRIDSQQRDLAASRLGEHYVAGRLSADELSERLARTYGARTKGELDGVLGDLPGTGA